MMVKLWLLVLQRELLEQHLRRKVKYPSIPALLKQIVRSTNNTLMAHEISTYPFEFEFDLAHTSFPQMASWCTWELKP